MSDFDPLDIEGQLQVETDRRQKQGNAIRTEKDDWAWLVGSKRGRRIVWRILEQTGVFQTSFTGNSETFFREGKRAVGLHVLSEAMAANPASFTLMMQEAKE